MGNSRKDVVESGERLRPERLVVHERSTTKIDFFSIIDFRRIKALYIFAFQLTY